MNLFRTKSIEQMRETAAHSGMAKTLGAVDLILLGIGCVIGTGIFVLTGVAAAKYAGPAVTISFMISGLACALAGLAYAEFSSIVPASGSAYTYTYASLGEFIAFIVGWNLILEYTVTASAVASGWSGYVTGLLLSAGIDPGHALTHVPADGGIINIPAIFITLLLSVLLIRGTQESTKLNRILVGVKLTAIAIFLLLAIPHVDTMNWEPFMPFGFSGVSAGAAVIVFAYLGVDSIATAAEETKNPAHDMPTGIIASLLICTVLYIAVTAVMTGNVPYTELDNAEPVAFVLRELGYRFGSALVGTGAIAGLTTVLLVMMYAQTRAFFAMSRDGLIPQSVCKIHPRFATPHRITILVGIAVAIISGFTPINVIAEMCSVGTLFAFIISSIGVMVMRRKYPDLPRPFRCPAIYVVGTLAIVSCGYIMYNLSSMTWERFWIWSALGILIYFLYGYRHSRENKQGEA